MADTAAAAAPGGRVLAVGEWNSSSLKFFSRFDGPYVTHDIMLGDHSLRKILEKQYEYISRNFYFISAYGRYLLGYQREDDVIKAETAAERTVTNAIKSLERKIKQAEAILTDAGIANTTLYGKNRTMQVPITTPNAKLYLRLLQLADAYYSLNALLWVEGEIDTKAKFANESATRKEIQGVVRGVASQFLYILKKTREKSVDEAAKVGDHDEEKLAEEAIKVVDTASSSAMVDNVSPETAVEALKPVEGDAATAGKPAKASKKAAAEPQAAAA